MQNYFSTKVDKGMSNIVTSLFLKLVKMIEKDTISRDQQLQND